MLTLINNTNNMNISKYRNKFLSLIIVSNLVACQQMSQIKKDRPPYPDHYFLKESDELVFYVSHKDLAKDGIKLEILPHKRSALIEKINIYTFIERNLHRFPVMPDGSPKKEYKIDTSAFTLRIYQNGKMYSTSSITGINRKGELESLGGLKIKVSDCFTKKSWKQIDFKNLENISPIL